MREQFTVSIMINSKKKNLNSWHRQQCRVALVPCLLPHQRQGRVVPAPHLAPHRRLLVQLPRSARLPRARSTTEQHLIHMYTCIIKTARISGTPCTQAQRHSARPRSCLSPYHRKQELHSLLQHMTMVMAKGLYVFHNPMLLSFPLKLNEC
jgi:hypothetical protein